MYAPDTTDPQVKAASKSLRFQLRYHTADEISTNNTLLDDLRDRDTGKLRRPLNAEERKYIRNEQALCKFDYLYWLRNYHHIIDWEGNVVTMRPNVAQQIILDCKAQMERRRLPIMLINLKARQLGITTEGIADVGHRVQFYKNVMAIVGSSTPYKSEEMYQKMIFSWDHQPWWLVPQVLVDRRGEAALRRFGDVDSTLSVQHGAKVNADVGRGQTPSVAMLCLAPNTLIRVSDGQVKKIPDIAVGDLVLSSDGHQHKVIACMKSPRQNELTSVVRLWGNFNSLVCTNDHPILTPDGFKPAQSLRSGDRACFPVRPFNHLLKTSPMTVFKAGGDPGIRKANPSKNWGTVDLPLNREFGWICGLYLSEGSIQRSTVDRDTQRRPVSVVFTCHEKEVPTFKTNIDEFLSVYDKESGTSAAHGKAWNIRVAWCSLARWIQDNFKSGHEKTIPDWVWDTSPDFALGILQGYLDGDGHFEEFNAVVATSIRLGILVQMRDIIASLNMGWTSIYYRPAGEWYNRNCSDAWIMHLSGVTGSKICSSMSRPTYKHNEPKHWRYSLDGRFIEIEVESVGEGYSESFYDIEVEDVHDFCTLHCCVHNSEVSEWLNPYNDIDAALRNAMHEHEDMLLQLESTARGMSGYWFDTWNYAVEHHTDTYEPSDLFPIFLPWYIGTDIYPTEVWMRKHPIPDDWSPSAYVLRHAERAQKYVANNTIIRRYLGSNWKLPRNQQWYYEVRYTEAKKTDKLNMFLQEMPADEMEAFQTQGHSIFDAEIISNYHNATSEPKATFMLDGPADEIRPELKPDQRWVDVNKRPIPIDGKYQLVPMRLNGWPDKNPDSRIYIWQLPEAESEYGFGVDTAQGIGLDSTNIECIRKADFKSVAAQVCEFNSNRINAVDVIPYLHVLGRMYSVNVKGQRRQPRMVIETMSGGDTTQLGMRKLGWNNFHAWLRYDRVNIDQSKVHVLGTVTTQWSRDMILAWLIAALRDLQFDIYSPWFVQEMRTLCKDENRQRIAGEFNSHDDRIMSMAWVYLSMHILESGEFRSPFGKSRIAMEQSPVEEPKYLRYKAPSSMTPTKAPDYDISPPSDELVAAMSWKLPISYPTQPPSPLPRPPDWRPT